VCKRPWNFWAIWHPEPARCPIAGYRDAHQVPGRVGLTALGVYLLVCLTGRVVIVNQASLIPLASNADVNGSLTVFEEGPVPFSVVRTFVVRAHAGQTRGQHAHRKCTQLLAALSGKIRVTVVDGTGETVFILSDSTEGLLIPPMVWATQEYLQDDSILLVACDQRFDEDDYIRDQNIFSRLTKTQSV
jgi:dTDP-4-dehydrorhamnose 3,5-epimerase-like enzyme